MDSVLQTYEKLQRLFEIGVQRNLADSILLSGGLDTSIVTSIASKYSRLSGFTVALGSAPDVEFARLIAKKFHLDHRIIEIDERDAERTAIDVISVMRTFDPMEVRNDVSLLIGLRAARDAGFHEVLTGDAGDELFAGYSFLFKKEVAEIEASLRAMWRIMSFSSIPLAGSLSMLAKLPFLDEELKNFAMTIPADLKVRQERGVVFGKWILRKTFEDMLPEEIIWRVKMPIEQGSGTSIMPAYFDAKFSDDLFSEMRKLHEEDDGVRLSSKEQLAYYEAYRAIFGIPKGSGEGDKACSACQAGVQNGANFCRTCGAYAV